MKKILVFLALILFLTPSSIHPSGLSGGGGTASVTKSQIFIANGNWTWPTGVTGVWVLLAGGGGGGQNIANGSGGGGGEVKTRWVTVAADVVVTIGAGGAVGIPGGTSSFGALLSALGGPIGEAGTGVKGGGTGEDPIALAGGIGIGSSGGAGGGGGGGTNYRGAHCPGFGIGGSPGGGGGGGGGSFGNGGNGGGNAAANSGGGGGSNGTGGSGICIVMWVQ